MDHCNLNRQTAVLYLFKGVYKPVEKVCRHDTSKCQCISTDGCMRSFNIMFYTESYKNVNNHPGYP